MDRTKNIPSIVMLAAAFVACITTIYFQYSTKEILIIVLLTSIIFLIIGSVIRRIAEKYLIIETIEETEESEEGKEDSEGREDESKEAEENVEKKS